MIIDTLKESILSKDKMKTEEVLTSMLEELNSNKDLVGIVTMPEVIAELHTLLIENLGVHPRSMLLKARVPNRNRRASLFVQAMLNGVRLSK